jgi:SIR2-like domain
MNTLDPLAWKQLVEAIAAEKCILFLGPGASVNFAPSTASPGMPSSSNRQEQFFRALAAEHPSRILSYHEGDGFLVFKDSQSKRLLLSEIKTFYQQPHPNPVLDLLAQIPFHLYVVVTPDLGLNLAFTAQGLSFKHQSYATKIKRSLEETPCADRPLIYNLFGCEAEPESLITTHGDFFDLIQSIYGDKNLPDELVALLHGDHTHNIVFLGFEFDKWYFQLLLHLLRIKFDAGFLYAAAQTLPKNNNRMLMEAQFKVGFVSTDIEGFVRKLHGHFSPAQLRQKATASPARKPNTNNIQKFILQAWSAPDFEGFCFTTFPRVYADFTPGMAHTARVSLLLQFLETHGQFDKLLHEGRLENPYQYDACGPYYAH